MKKLYIETYGCQMNIADSEVVASILSEDYTIISEIKESKPDVIVTYPVHGISGFYDHLVTHAVVKRAFIEVREHNDFLKRLAFHTITSEQASKSEYFHLYGSSDEEIDCIYHVDDEDVKKANLALDCYITFQETINNSGIRQMLSKDVYFEIFQENFKPPINDLFYSIFSN